MIGVIRSATSACTRANVARAMIRPTATSIRLPRVTKSRNPLSINLLLVCTVRFCEDQRLRGRRPSAPVATRPRPCAAGRREVGWVGAEVALQPARGECSGGDQPEQQRGFRRLVVARRFDDEDQRGERDHEQGDGAVEAACFGMRPGIQGPDDLAAAVRVGAGRLARAPVADVRLGAVAHQPALVVELVRPEVLAFRALPVVLRLVVGEAGGPVAERAAVRMRRQPFQHERAGHEQGGVAGAQ